MPPSEIQLRLPRSSASLFYPLLQKGVRVETIVNCSIKKSLCTGIGFGSDYIDNRVQTIFLNHKAVDDIERIIIGKNSILALSAALPGTAGAILRKGGKYAAMRVEISHPDENKEKIRAITGIITLKLFNLTLKELCPTLLKKGIEINLSCLKKILGEKIIGGIVTSDIKKLPSDSSVILKAIFT